MDSCERALSLSPDDGAIHDSRGLARALTGNTAGAIEDFNVYIAWAKQKGLDRKDIAQREEWIATLQAGRNPFDQANLEALRIE
jgi:hypothetical protein